MANNSDLGVKLALVGAGNIPTSYGTGTLFCAGAATGLAVQLVFTFDGSTVLTSINVRLPVQRCSNAAAPVDVVAPDVGTPELLWARWIAVTQ